MAVANLELQLCLNRSPQSKLGSPTLLTLGLLSLLQFIDNSGCSVKAEASSLASNFWVSLISQQFPFVSGDLEL